MCPVSSDATYVSTHLAPAHSIWLQEAANEFQMDERRHVFLPHLGPSEEKDLAHGLPYAVH